MSIVTLERDDVAYVWCDGCGKSHKIPTCHWPSIMAIVSNQLAWFTVPFDYGYGVGAEHFCCSDCLDPPEWETR
jgi:hypothetical protein